MTDAPPRAGLQGSTRSRTVVIFLTALLFGVLLCGGGGLWALFHVLPGDDADRSEVTRVANAYLDAWQRQDVEAAIALLHDPKVKDPTEFAALLRTIGVRAYRVTGVVLTNPEKCSGQNCPAGRATVTAELTTASGATGVLIPMIKKQDDWFRKDGDLWHVAGGERYLCRADQPPRDDPTC
ncbi:hypothetical protein GCM10009557_09120 [Virgisporangium ochraceum]|uniref:Uncharacterized protein n=1 Tax=Virgisporangium ochraceum TaxID=65505 RepID=A0A8J3ZSF3_9ACTN|nr:hypothetical protein [Virgisporangium ochraceum]GIJ69634.1 hypothetical protein Voc01_045510 [Virgisporangium ochraceum]